MSLQGYENILDQSTGKSLAVERATGEVYETITTTVPAGTIFYTPERQRAYKAKREREEEERLLAEERRHRRNNTPKFYFISAEGREHELRPATMARLVYLATFLDYQGRLKVNLQRTMKFSDLEGILQIKKSEVYCFWREVRNNYVVEDKYGCLYMQRDFSCRGRLPCGERYQQFYIDSVRKLYRKTRPTSHRYLGYVFQMLPFISTEYNIVCHNPLEQDLDCIEPFSIDEFCNAIRYNPANRARLMKTYAGITFPVDGKQEQFCAFVTKGADIGSTKIFVNPHILYHGKLDMHTQILGKLCDFAT